MDTLTWSITAVAAHPLGVQITGRALVPRWQVGQAMQVAVPGTAWPHTALPWAIEADHWAVYLPAHHPLAGLAPGDEVLARAPLGKPVLWPPAPFRLLVTVPDLSRVWALVLAALARRADVAVLWPPDLPLPDLPPEIEIHRTPLTPDLHTWADVILLDAGDAPHLTPPRKAWVLATPPMPCGTGACVACGVRLGSHHHLACQTGPIILP